MRWRLLGVLPLLMALGCNGRPISETGSEQSGSEESESEESESGEGGELPEDLGPWMGVWTPTELDFALDEFQGDSTEFEVLAIEPDGSATIETDHCGGAFGLLDEDLTWERNSEQQRVDFFAGDSSDLIGPDARFQSMWFDPQAPCDTLSIWGEVAGQEPELWLEMHRQRLCRQTCTTDGTVSTIVSACGQPECVP